MAHWKLKLSYNGANFHGWQIQPGLVTVQGTLADALREITGASVLPQGAGRTDAGVHALAQVASFSLPTPIPPPNLHRALNRVLPPSLRVLEVCIVPLSFHARHSSRRKLYEYRIFERRALESSVGASSPDIFSPERICSPFLAPFVWDCRWPVDLALLQQSAAMLLGTHDFSAMAATARAPRDDEDVAGSGQSLPNPVKTIYSSAWHRGEGLLVYQVCGSGFLHHMVRNMVGTMIDIGRGSRTLKELVDILASRDRSQAGPTAPASGLYLVEVLYELPEGRNPPAAVQAAAEQPSPFAPAGVGA